MWISGLHLLFKPYIWHVCPQLYRIETVKKIDKETHSSASYFQQHLAKLVWEVSIWTPLKKQLHIFAGKNCSFSEFWLKVVYTILLPWLVTCSSATQLCCWAVITLCIVFMFVILWVVLPNTEGISQRNADNIASAFICFG